jgi:hypothetical protein
MATVAETLIGLRKAISNQSPDDHVLVGSAALATPDSQLEVTEGEASVEPTENPGTDLLTELIERPDD